jgi:arginine N-succinyltransferase
MLFVRPARVEDVDRLHQLVQEAETGLSTLKISRDLLSERIEESVRVFNSAKARPKGQPYVFVMEDPASGKVVGTSAIYSKVGGFEPFYTYEIKTVVKKSKVLVVEKEIRYLELHTTHDGPTEIGSLFLSRDYQGKGNGRLLSLARFLFIAEFPERFEDDVIAELRGVVDNEGHSPLWDALGSHFFQIDYPRAETQTQENKKFIAELMPRHPIYVPLLPREAQEVLGKVHHKTEPARKLLVEEGFRYIDFVDIFDGGPTYLCRTPEIRSIRDSQVLTVSGIESQVSGSRWLVSNRSLDFRATLGRLAISGSSAIISEDMAALLNVQVGHSLRAVAPRVAS